jgi:predicted transcriptional regulator
VSPGWLQGQRISDDLPAPVITCQVPASGLPSPSIPARPASPTRKNRRVTHCPQTREFPLHSDGLNCGEGFKREIIIFGCRKLKIDSGLENNLIITYTHIHQHMPEVTSIRMRTDTKALLDDLKINPRETYDDVVRRLAESAYDDEPLSPEEIKAMEEGIADIKAGRVYTLDEIMKECGDDKVIKARNL